MTGIEIIGLIASVLQLAGFLHSQISRVRRLFSASISLRSRCCKFSKYLNLIAKTLKPYLNPVWEGKPAMGEIVKELKGELNKARELVSKSLGRKGLLRWWSAFRFPKKLKESQEDISKLLTLLQLAASSTVQVTPAQASTSKARQIARVTPATNRRRGQAPTSGSSVSRAQKGPLPIPSAPKSASGDPLQTQPTPASASGAPSVPRSPQGPLPIPPSGAALRTQPTPASASGAPSVPRSPQGPLRISPAPTSVPRSPQGPLPITSKGKGKAVAFDHKRIRGNR